MLPPNYMSRIPLSILKLIGEHLRYSSKLLNAYRLFNIVAMSTVVFFIAVGPFKEEKSKRYAEYMESFSGSLHTEAMYLFFIYNKTRIENLLTELTKIRWNPKDFTENFLASDQKFQKRIAFATCSFTIHSAILVHVFMLRPALQGSLYILETWEPESFVLATIVLALQYYLFLLLPTTIMTFDCLYLALCAEIVTQVRRLQYKMRRLFRDPVDSVRTRNEVCYLVRCHDHLLRAFRRMQEIYSFALLFHYFLTLDSNCAELYTLLRSSKLEIERIMSIIALVCQFAFYTFPAEALTVEFEKVSTALYMSDWYKGTIDCQKLLLFTIMRAQLRECLLGGGIMEINLRAFTSVLKLSFSVYTLLRNTVYS